MRVPECRIIRPVACYRPGGNYWNCAIHSECVRQDSGYAMIDCADANSGRNSRPVCLLPFPWKSPRPLLPESPCSSTSRSGPPGALSYQADHRHRRRAHPQSRAGVRRAGDDDARRSLSGTDRVAEVASARHASVIVNIQGDEPLIDPAAIDAAVLGLLDDAEVPMAHAQEAHRRSARDRRSERRQSGDRSRTATRFIFRAGRFRSCATADRPFISNIWVCTFTGAISCSPIPDLPVGPLERMERLEQLRALENGHRDPRGGNRVRIARRRHAGGSGASVGAF